MTAYVIKLEMMAEKQKHQLLTGKNETHTFFPQHFFVRNFLLSYPISSYNPITITVLIKYQSIMPRYYRPLQPRHFLHFLHWLLKKIIQQNESKHCKMCTMDSKNTTFLLNILIKYYQMKKKSFKIKQKLPLHLHIL